MRKTLLMLPLTAVAMFATTAIAQQPIATPQAEAATGTVGVATGTVVGVGVSEAWFGAGAAAALPVGAVGAAAIGGGAGIGAVALLHAATTPCQGVHALLGGLLTSSEGCENGHWVGYQPRRFVRR
jgi:hypothetical protein